MGSIRVEEPVGAPVEEVWKLLADFGGVARFMPGLAGVDVTGSGVGAVRAVKLDAGAVVKERLEKLDPGARTLSYAIIEGPMPVRNFLATIRVLDAGACRARVEWSATFDAPGLDAAGVRGFEETMEKAYRGAIASARKLLEQ
jgi:carbon monoxide dehydrogenase subunit G